MVALGPRVGGAHVDVNLKYDPKSGDTLGRRIHRQLTKIGDRNRKIYQQLGSDAVTAWRAALGALVTAAPLMGSLISGIAGAATMLAGALYSTVQSAYGLAPVLVAIGIAAGTAAIGMKGFFEAVQTGEMGNLTPAARDAAQAVRSLSGAWERVRQTVQENMFAGLAGEIRQLSTTLLPAMERGLGKMATAINGVVRSLLEYINSSAGLKQIETLLNNSADIFDRLGKAVVPFLDGTLRLLNALAPAGKRLADRIAEVAEKFQSWTQAEGFGKRIDDMMKRAEKTAGLLLKVIGNLGRSITNIFAAANPSTNTFLEMLVGLTERWKEWTGSVEGQESIAKWASESVEVMRQFGHTLEAVFEVLNKLSDSRVIISFLNTVEGAFNHLAKLPLEAMVNGFVVMAEALEPISSAFLAIIIAGAAFNIMIGSIVGQLGGLVSVITRMIPLGKGMSKFLGGIGGGGKHAAGGLRGLSSTLNGLALNLSSKVFPSAGKHIAQVGKHATTSHRAFGPFLTIVKSVSGVLARFAKFAGPVGIAVWIGSIIAKSEELQKKLGKVWDALKEVGSSVATAFKEIGAALAPLKPVADGAGKAFSFVFDLMDKLMGLAIGVFLDMVIYGFKSLANVISGAGKIIAGLINIFVGFFTLFKDPAAGFEKMWDGLKQLASGIGPLLKGIFGLFVTFFAPAKLAKLGLGAIKGLGSGIKNAAPGILSTVGKFVLNILKFFLTLTPRLLTYGARALASLGQAVVRGAPAVLAKVGSLVSGFIGWIARLPGRLLKLGAQALSRLGNAVVTGTPKVLNAAGKIFTGVVNWIARLPGRLLTLGQQAVTRLANAVRAGIARLRTIASNIFNGIINALKNLPGRLLSMGRDAVNRFAGAVSNGISRLRNIAGNIFNAVKDKLKGLPGELLSIGKNMISKLASGILGGLGKIKDAAGKIGSAIKNVLPGSPVKEGPLTAWNRGSDASGGGHNVVDAITAGLSDTSPIRKAMDGVASAVATSLTPSIGAGRVAGGVGGGSVDNSRSLQVTIHNPQAETGSDSLTRTTRNLAYLGLA